MRVETLLVIINSLLSAVLFFQYMRFSEDILPLQHCKTVVMVLGMETEEDVLNLNEDADYLNGDELMDENEDDDEALAVEDTLMSRAETRKKRGGKRRHCRCWKHFAIIGEKYPDGTNDVECKFCKLSYCLNL
ncbi:hypothetical protein IGI04_035651, partial [Brassica rapa subsp. trilocularis]